jgi:hypothetical protein
MKRYPLLLVWLITILSFSGCTLEGADTVPMINMAAESERLTSIHQATGERNLSKNGVVKATEWNDLANWPTWAQQLKKGEALLIQKKWKLSLQHRYTVILTDSLGKKIPDAHISLETLQGSLLAQSRTDNTGRVELFPSSVTKQENLRLKIVYANQVFYTGNLEIVQGIIEKQLNIRRQVSPKQDIVFVVDMSESINDELSYLQNQLKPIINRVKEESTDGLSIQLGSVFSGEHSGKPVNFSFLLTNNLNNAISHIKGQNSGRSNVPSIIDLALEEAVYRQPWSKEAINRLVFLLLDSPFQFNPATVERFTRIASEAARKGIKIIPVVAGSVNKETEFLLRSLAIRTNGTYIFTPTINSPANNLLQASTPDFTPEPLNDLLVRLIGQYNEVK